MDDAKIYRCYEEQDTNEGDLGRYAFFIFGLIAGLCIGFAVGAA